MRYWNAMQNCIMVGAPMEPGSLPKSSQAFHLRHHNRAIAEYKLTVREKEVLLLL